ncbi:MAG: hypothetical protein M1374_07090 [Firmicutes bacterium]|jgi:hypothetical protein|nr:hypothetical protein [Bacillota bacterium]
MFDHIFLDVISKFKYALEQSLLEPQQVEERLLADILSGDLSFETSYSLPGEQSPPRVRADITMEWPTWSQSAYRSWSIGEPFTEVIEIAVEVTLRLQRLKKIPDPNLIPRIMETLSMGTERETFEISGPRYEEVYVSDNEIPQVAAEISLQSVLRLEESALETRTEPAEQVSILAGIIASGLVRLVDLDLPFYRAEDTDSLD